MELQQLVGLHQSSTIPITSYIESQHNAQKILGPPKEYNGPKPGEQTEIFITNLPKWTNLKLLYNLGSCIGPIYMARLPVTYTEAKGFAFIRFFNPETAEKAVQRLNGFAVGDKILQAKLSRDSRQLIVKQWPISHNESISLAIFKEALSVPIVSVKLYEDPVNPAHHMGFCVLLFETHDDAARARRDVKQGALLRFTKSAHEVEDVRQDPEIPEERFKLICQLHVAGVPASATLPDFQAALKLCFVEKDVFRMKIKLHASEGYAFVLFPSHEAALEGSIKMRGKGLTMDQNKLRVHWVKGEYLQTDKVGALVQQMSLEDRCRSDSDRVVQSRSSPPATTSRLPASPWIPGFRGNTFAEEPKSSRSVAVQTDNYLPFSWNRQFPSDPKVIQKPTPSATQESAGSQDSGLPTSQEYSMF